MRLQYGDCIRNQRFLDDSEDECLWNAFQLCW